MAILLIGIKGSFVMHYSTNMTAHTTAFVMKQGARCSFVVEHPLEVQWVVGSILHGGPIELFLVPASVPRLVQQRLWYVLSCLWDGAHIFDVIIYVPSSKEFQDVSKINLYLKARLS